MLLCQLRQATKLDWATDGDANTSFYHAMIKHRRRTNGIHMLSDDMDRIITDPAQISQHVIMFYKKFLGQTHERRMVDREVLDAGPKVSVNMGFRLMAEVTAAEVKQSLQSTGNKKSPGPDRGSS